MISQESLLGQIVWQEIHWPHPLDAIRTLNLLRQWAAQVHAPQIILEARATKNGIRFLVGSQRRHEAALRRDIEQMVPGAIVAAEITGRSHASVSRRIMINHPIRPLESHDNEGSTRSILASLAGLRGNELLVMQIVLGPRLAPQLLPERLPRTDQGLSSLALTGIQEERRPHVAKEIQLKQSDHGFAAVIRVGVHATDEARRATLIKRVVSSLRTLLTPGLRLREHREKVQKLNTPVSEWAYFTPAQRLSVAEVGLLSGWPVGAIDVPYPGMPPIHPRPIRPSFTTGDKHRVVAQATAPGATDTMLGITADDSRRHIWLMGPTGVGKSSLLLSMIHDDMLAGRGLVVVEPKDLIRDVLAVVPASRRDDIVLLDPLDSEPVGINPLDLHGRSPALVADQLFGTFKALYGADGLGPRSSDILRHCLLALTSRGDASLAMLPVLLTNPGFRRSVTQRIARSDPFSAGPFWRWFDQLTPEASAQVTAPLMNKLRPLLDPHLRHVLAQRNPRFNIRQVLTQRKILLVPLQKGVLGPEAAELLGALVVGELWQAIQERAGIDPKDRDTVMVYLDEVQDYLRIPTSDLADVLATSRSLGAAFHVAHQYMDQLPIAMRSAFEANCRSRIFFQLAAKDARAAAAMAPGLDPEDFTSLPARNVYAQLVNQGTVTDWASGKTITTPKKSANMSDIQARSRGQYGQATDAIDQGLLDIFELPQDRPESGERRRRSTS
ncbi:type IV secretion system DNA-binding domain-containing protein [Pseudarthrobacter psychrotolerans]|uniref:Type IV secretion system DNA-binding domain-containing protein n=1 Tax=Pseudarthrobacter psychrotolerans TaxID=2697569 RepID=A0A6P1NJT1_9MICC|nr:type IV secretion system DNA-binding domain-containing protein [Pseudarthrobacter psychrotolerans]QHK19849.1 type IV secretion system DNA-binding domain-containing protein [Pseudarthrobacter psychrotolerans]